MTLSEFKAWFEGFTENMPGPPTGEQFERIKARVKEIDGETVTLYRYFDYLPRRRWWRDQVTCIAADAGSTTEQLWNSTSAMLALGRIEATTK